MAAFIINRAPSPLIRTGSIQVPLFDAPYFVPQARTAVMQSQWPYYIGSTSNVNTNLGFSDFLLHPLTMASFEAFASTGPVSNLATYSYYFGTTACFMNYPNQSLFHPMVAGAQSYGTYPLINLPSGWITRDVSRNADTNQGGWFQDAISIFNINPLNNTVWLAPISNPSLLLEGATPTISTTYAGIKGTFSLLNSQQSNTTFAHYFQGNNTNTTAYIWPIEFDSIGNIPQNFLTPIVTDDAALNTALNTKGGSFPSSMSEYGILLFYTTTSPLGPVYFPNQAYQALLLSYNLSNGLNLSGHWAPIQFLPQTANSNTLIHDSHSIAMKIDNNGIFYYDLFEYANKTLPHGYTANSFGIDISIPGIPLLPENNGIPLQVFCPCSPVAIGGNS